MKNRRAAMEMSVGTIVTIVLVVSMMIVGLYFVSKIRGAGEGAIDGIDSAVTSELQKLFAEDDSRKIVIYPKSREIGIKKGEDTQGFGFSIRNVGQESDTFSYMISATETSCDMRLTEADNLITLGREGQKQIPAGDIMDDPVFVRFDIPETAPPCQIRYSITMEKGTQLYGSSVDVDLTIEGK